MSENCVETYRTQLEQVQDLLKTSTNPQEQQNLESLKSDLQNLIDLTLQQQEIEQGNSNNNGEKFFDHSKCEENNMESLFVSKIRYLENTLEDTNRDDEIFDKKLQKIKDELENMVGEKCSAPHTHKWGSTVYHNAIICGLDHSTDYELNCIDIFKFRILFTNPTHKEMIPCPYYLNGSCKFDSTRCTYSHGELIPFNELKDYQIPDFTKLDKNCIVLAKHGELWHQGRVILSNFSEKTCIIRINNQKKEIKFNFEDIFPMYQDECFTYNDELKLAESDTDEEDDETLKLRQIDQTLLNPVTNQNLGDWEKHTKGIGSKLMRQMGYIFGRGLGTKGEGLVVPVSAQILPAGRSLDYCMNLREISNGGTDFFSAERKFEKEQNKQKKLNQNAYNKPRENDVFSFLNKEIFSGVISKSMDNKDDKNKLPGSSTDFRNQSMKTLNVECVKIADGIRKKQKEIEKIKDSIKRHQTGSSISKHLNSLLNTKNQELASLKKSEKNLNNERKCQKNKKELFIF